MYHPIEEFVHGPKLEDCGSPFNFYVLGTRLGSLFSCEMLKFSIYPITRQKSSGRLETDFTLSPKVHYISAIWEILGNVSHEIHQRNRLPRAWNITMYSASAVDKAVSVYSLLIHKIGKYA